MPQRSASNSGSVSPQRRPAERPNNRSPSPNRSPPREQDENLEEPKVYVSGLPADASKNELREKFEEFGEITDIFVINKDSFSFGFVTYTSHKEAKDAIDTMTGREIGGKTIRCNIAKPRPGGPRGGQGGRDGGDRDRPRGKGCFKCGEEGHFARECPNGEGQGGSRGPARRQSRRRSGSGSQSPPKRRHRRSRSNSSSRSPVKRRHKRQSGSRSPKRHPRHQRSRSAERRKGSKARKGSSSGSR